MTVHALPAVDEEFVRRPEMARRLALKLRTFDELCAEGRRIGFPPPTENWGLRIVVFPTSRTIAWARAMTTRKAAS